MVKLTTHYLKSDNTYVLVRQWTTNNKPNGVIHLLHGMMEHSGMYHNWANRLCELGWDVVAHDHPGSGYTIIPNCSRDHLPMNGAELLTQIAYQVDAWIRERYPNKTVIRYGHSMGSFIALMMGDKDQGVTDVIISGSTVESSIVLRIQTWVIWGLSKLIGMNNHAWLAHVVTFYPMNAKFKPTKTSVDWVSRSESVRHQYLTDPLCGNVVSWGYFYALNQALFKSRQTRRKGGGEAVGFDWGK